MPSKNRLDQVQLSHAYKKKQARLSTAQPYHAMPNYGKPIQPQPSSAKALSFLAAVAV